MRMLTWNVLNRTIMEPFDCWSFLLMPKCSTAPTMGWLGLHLSLTHYVGGEVAWGKALSWRLGVRLCSWIDLVDMSMFLLGGCFPFTCVWQCCYIGLITLTIVTFAEWCWFSNSLKKKKNIEQSLFVCYPLPKDKRKYTSCLCSLEGPCDFLVFFWMYGWKKIHCKERVKKYKKSWWIGQEKMCKTLNPSNLFHRNVLRNGLQKLMQKLITLKPTPPKGIANK
jgi:hypothetical protein